MATTRDKRTPTAAGAGSLLMWGDGATDAIAWDDGAFDRIIIDDELPVTDRTARTPI